MSHDIGKHQMVYDRVCILHVGVELASYLVGLYNLYRHVEDIERALSS